MKVGICVLLVSLVAFVGLAQTQGAQPPFVTGITATVEDNAVLISWKDPQAAVETLLVYRNSQEITADNLSSSALVGSVKAGTQEYLDHPPDTKPYFYAVLVADENGNPYPSLVDFRNRTKNAVAVSTTTPMEKSVALVSDIKASVKSGGVDITFVVSNSDATIALYRSTSPLTTNDDLVNAVLVQTSKADKTELLDNPIPGIPYYYAIFDEALLRVGNPSFVPGGNVLKVPVEIPLSEAETGGLQSAPTRVIPLPYLRLANDIETGKPLISPGQVTPVSVEPLDTATAKAVDKLLAGTPKTKVKEPTPEILPEDAANTTAPDPYSLSGIVAGSFSKGDYSSAEKLLRTFLNIKRSNKVQSRAHFYIGQCYYFLGQYRESFVEFLFAEDDYYAEAQPWIDLLYVKLRSS